MRITRCILSSFLLGLPLLAATDADREFHQLQDQHAKALVEAVAPVNARYQALLETLLRRATQGNDLETALKVRQELQKLGTSVSPAGATTTAPVSLASRLKDTQWRLSDSKTFTLKADGTSQSSWTPRKGTWKVTGPNEIELDVNNVPRRKKGIPDPEFMKLDMGEETATRIMPP